MPIRERKCGGCDRVYEVLTLGARVTAMYGATGEFGIGDGIRCAGCGSNVYEDVYNVRFAAVALGGEAGVGKFYPYHDRALGPGRGLLVKDAKHRKWLMEHEPNGRARDVRLLPLESKTDSALRGTWEDIADAEADENAKIDADYKASQAEVKHMVKQVIADQPAAAPILGGVLNAD